MTVGGAAGRRSSFEISVSREDKPTVIYSKLEKGSFPSPDDVMAAIEKFIADGSVLPIGAAPAGGCSVQCKNAMRAREE